jgi:hypothetical protein
VTATHLAHLREPAARGDRPTFVRSALLLAVVLLAGACSGDDSSDIADVPDGGEDIPGEAPAADGGGGATATWRIDENDPPDEAATSFTALVTRLGCSGGETGLVLEPVVDVDDERIKVTFAVESLPPGDYECPGNDAVPHVVVLDEPVGDRELVDGACLSGEAATTAFCVDEDPVRWPPQP